MKSLVIILGILCLGLAAVVVHTRLSTPTPPLAVAETAAEPSSVPPPEATPPAKTLSVKPIARSATASHSFVASAGQSHADYTVDPARAFKEAIEQLVSPNIAFKDKEAIWKKLIADGRLDETIEALKQGAANNPDSAAYQAALGEANLKKAGVVSQNGGSMSDLGILGMTADQSFDRALKIDPANWDAQFFKAVSMSYWPAELNKGGEVVQRLTDLITQQDTQATRPEFALAYIALGQQYQKLGQTDYALQTWQAGAAKFPDDTTLPQKIAGAQAK